MERPPERLPPDPRFLLSNERTMLAWLRTSLAFVATGLALVALRHVGYNSDWLMAAAAASCLVGVVSSLWAYGHWRGVDRAIRTATPLPRPTIAPLLVLGVVVLASAGFVAIAVRL